MSKHHPNPTIPPPGIPQMVARVCAASIEVARVTLLHDRAVEMTRETLGQLSAVTAAEEVQLALGRRLDRAVNELGRAERALHRRCHQLRSRRYQRIGRVLA